MAKEQSSGSDEPAGTAAPPAAETAKSPEAGAMASTELRNKLKASLLAGLAPSTTAPEPIPPSEDEPPSDDANEESKEPADETPAAEEPAEEESAQAEPETEEPEETAKEKARLEEIRNLRSDRRALRDELTEIKEKLQAAEESAARPVVPTPGVSPLLGVRSLDQLSKTEQELKTRVRLIEDYQDGTLEGLDRANFETWAKQAGAWDEENERAHPAKLKSLKRTGQELLAEDVPSRKEYLNTEPKVSRMTEESFPWWKDPDSEEYAIAKETIELYPWLRNDPKWKARVSVYVLGVKALEAQVKSNGGPKAGQPPRPGKPKLPTAPLALPAAALRPSAPDAGAKFGEALKNKDRDGMRAALAQMIKVK